MQQYSDSRSSNIRAMVQPDWVLGLVGRLAWPEQHFSARLGALASAMCHDS